MLADSSKIYDEYDQNHAKTVHLSFILYAFTEISGNLFSEFNHLVKMHCNLNWWYDEYNEYLRLVFTYKNDQKFVNREFKNIDTIAFGRIGELICKCLFLNTICVKGNR